MKLKIALLITALAFIIAGCKNNTKDQSAKEATKMETKTPKEGSTLLFNPNDLPEVPIFDIKTTLGTIRVKLYKETPKHKDNFIKLASTGFYNNILFHRVIKDFMIQVGDPLTKDATADKSKYGTGGPGYTIPAEILPNLTHKKGALAAARRGDKSNPNRESSGSQFYIVHSPEQCVHLDGQYTIFGETLSGFEVIDAIANTPVGAKDLPTAPVKIESILPITE